MNVGPATLSHFHSIEMAPYGWPNTYGRKDDTPYSMHAVDGSNESLTNEGMRPSLQNFSPSQIIFIMLMCLGVWLKNQTWV